MNPYIFAGLPSNKQNLVVLGIKDTNNVVNLVSRVMNVSIEEMRGKSRKQYIVDAKSIAMFLLSHIEEWTLHQIADNFMIDHSTVHYHINRCENLRTYDKKFRSLFNSVAEDMPIIKDIVVNKTSNYSKKVIDIISGVTYNTAYDAAKDKGLNVSTIYWQARNKKGRHRYAD